MCHHDSDLRDRLERQFANTKLRFRGTTVRAGQPLTTPGELWDISFLIKGALNLKDFPAAIVGITALGHLGGDDDIRFLRVITRDCEDVNVQISVTKAVAAIGGRQALFVLDQIADDRDLPQSVVRSAWRLSREIEVGGVYEDGVGPVFQKEAMSSDVQQPERVGYLSCRPQQLRAEFGLLDPEADKDVEEVLMSLRLDQFPS